MYRSSFSPVSTVKSRHESGSIGPMTCSFGSCTVRSGLPMCHRSVSSNTRAGGMSAEFPLGLPSSTHLTMVATSRSESDGSSLNFWMPTLRSMYQGGISRLDTLILIDVAHGRASSYVMSDIGAMDPGWWQFWHERWRIGATSLVKVTCPGLAELCSLAVTVSFSPTRAMAASSIARPALSIRECLFMITPWQAAESAGLLFQHPGRSSSPGAPTGIGHEPPDRPVNDRTPRNPCQHE